MPRGIHLREFDLDAALRRTPQLILVDELAHSNAPGCRHTKRYQDIEELLRAGMDVYTTVNVQHLESLNDLVSSITRAAEALGGNSREPVVEDAGLLSAPMRSDEEPAAGSGTALLLGDDAADSAGKLDSGGPPPATSDTGLPVGRPGATGCCRCRVAKPGAFIIKFFLKAGTDFSVPAFFLTIFAVLSKIRRFCKK